MRFLSLPLEEEASEQGSDRTGAEEDTGEADTASTSSSPREPLLSPTERSTAQSASTRPSRNVTLTLLYTAFAFAGRSIWSQSVLATFVYLLRDNSPEAVGYITAVMGLSQLLASFPAGFFADWYRRDVLLKLACTLGTLAVLVTLLACYHENYRYLVAALAVWGVYWGVASTALSALFADSIPTGERSYYFTQRSILVTFGSSIGPVVALVMFGVLGDQSTVQHCAAVTALGQCVCFPAVVMLCFLNDDYAVVATNQDDENNGDTSNIEQETSPSSTSVLIDSELGALRNGGSRTSCQPPRAVEAADNACTVRPEQAPPRACQGSETSIQVMVNQHDSRETPPPLSFCASLCHGRKLPILIASADLIASLAGGMSILYFPIFFVNHLHLGPVQVQILYTLTPLMMAVLMKISQLLARRLGRLHVVVLNKWIGATFMLAMIAATKYQLATPLICTLYVLRTGFMNSTSALSRSALMDNVPVRERGKWSAVESVNVFGWSGSAALGGVLVGNMGLLRLFGITAALQLLATFPLIYLFSNDTLEQLQQPQRMLEEPPRRRPA